MGTKIILGIIGTFFIVLILGILYQFWFPKRNLSTLPPAPTPTVAISPAPTISLFPETGPIQSPVTQGVSRSYLRSTLNPIDVNFGQFGIAFISEKDGKAQVSVIVNPLDNLNNQPAHIHSGSCPGVGQVLYPLNVINNGRSETTLNISLAELQRSLPLLINVHKSNSEMQIYTSCGNITNGF